MVSSLLPRVALNSTPNQVEIYVDVDDPEEVVIEPLDELFVGENYGWQPHRHTGADCRSKRSN